MNLSNLGSALTRMRLLARVVPPGTTAGTAGGATPEGENPQQMQGFGGAGTTGTSGTNENIERFHAERG